MHLWIILALCVLTAAGSAGPEKDQHEMELSTFYANCDNYDDPSMFGGPVCGSDGKTYSNCVHFACKNHWRPPQDKVKMVCKGPCENYEPSFPWSPVYMPVCGTDNKTYANVEALMLHNMQKKKDDGDANDEDNDDDVDDDEDNDDEDGDDNDDNDNGDNGDDEEDDDEEVLVQYDGQCADPSDSCLGVDPEPWEDAVCASNGRTYPSVQAIADMRMFGQCLDVLHDGGCTVDEVKERVKGRAEICDLARNFYEYNPVCGDDGVTYANPYILLCFRPNVKAAYQGECDSAAHKACQRAVDIDSGAAESEGAVCASDGLTYTSVHHLECAKSMDKHLMLAHKGPCVSEDSPCNTMPEVSDAGEPVCGSDGVTYVNPHALWCVQRREDPFLTFFHDGPCFRRCVECSCGCGSCQA